MSQAVEFACQLAPVAEPGTTDHDLYAEALADARLGHALGYSTGWVIEHHFSDYYPTPNPLLLLAHVAAQCPGFGLGTAVLVLPWYNPLRLAEDIAMLQLLSSGPLHLGIGRGTAKFEYDALGIPMEEARERFHECWDIIRTALAGGKFTYDGKYNKIEVPIELRPHLGDRRPRFYGAVSSPSSSSIMAREGISPMTMLNFPHEVLGGIISDWKGEVQRTGGDAANAVYPIMTQTYIADTDDQARAQAQQFLPYYYQVQVDHYDSEADVWKDMPSYQETGKLMRQLKHYTVPENLGSQLELNLIGTPKTIIERLEKLIGLGYNHFIIRNGTPGVPRSVRHTMMRRFAAEVMPHFQSGRQVA